MLEKGILKERKTIPEKSTSDAATEESWELEKSKDASVLKQYKEIHLLIQEKRHSKLGKQGILQKKFS